MVSCRHHGDADDNADKKVRFEWLLLGFMAKELLPQNGPRPAPVTPIPATSLQEPCAYLYAPPFYLRHT
jgi:hypothetical protein